MIQIQRGDTERVTVKADADLTGHTCRLSIGFPNSPLLTVGGAEMEADGEETTLVFTLTQQQTLSLPAGRMKLQLRAVNGDVSVGWPLVDVEVLPVIDKGVMADGQ